MSKILLCSLLIAISLFLPLNHTTIANELPPKVPSALKQLEKDSDANLEIIWSKETNTPSKLTGKLSPPSKHTPEWIVYEFLIKWRTLYGFQNPKRDLKVVKVNRYDDKVSVHLQHLVFQTPIWEDWLIIDIGNDGVIQRIEGTIHPNLRKKLFNRPMYPAISKKQAIEKAKEITPGELATEPKVENYYLATRSGTPLIYVVRLHYNNPDRTITTWIHSLTGRIIEQNNH